MMAMRKIASFFRQFKPLEIIIWVTGVLAITISFFAFQNDQYLYLAASLVGITGLIFVSKGHFLGPTLSIAFSIIYGFISYFDGFYGGLITYLGMSMPINAYALIVWLRHPSKKKNQVQVNTISKYEFSYLLLTATLLMFAFYYIFNALNTENILLSCLSVFASFVAVYLTARRSQYYALFYMINDIISIANWALASKDDLRFLPMVICFVFFFINDSYALYNWSRMKKRQTLELSDAQKNKTSNLKS